MLFILVAPRDLPRSPRLTTVLEVLPIALPLELKKPSAAEMVVLEENDQRIVILLKYSLGPILTVEEKV
jgi:hypothetical protein